MSYCTENFVLISFIGEGAFGEVYKVYDKTLRKDTALKISKEDSKRIDQEIDVFIALNRFYIPNVVRLIGEGYCDLLANKRYYEMSLHKNNFYIFIKNKNTITLHEYYSILVELLYTLSMFRKYGFVHRDLTSFNILYDTNENFRNYELSTGEILTVDGLIQPIISDFNTSKFLTAGEVDDSEDLFSVLNLLAELVDSIPDITDSDIGTIQKIFDYISEKDDKTHAFLQEIISKFFGKEFLS